MINIGIKDHNSKTIGLIPSNLHETIALIAKVKRFDSIDDYVIDVLKRELESLRVGGHAANDFGESIAKYLQNMIPPFGSSFSSDDDDDDDDDEENDDEGDKTKQQELYEEIPVTLRLNKNIAEVARIFAKYYHNDRLGYFDKFINEQVIKTIKSLASEESLVPIQEKFPDSLKQHIQNLLNEANNNNNNNNKNMEDLK